MWARLRGRSTFHKLSDTQHDQFWKTLCGRDLHVSTVISISFGKEPDDVLQCKDCVRVRA